jgi:hypothetical protein
MRLIPSLILLSLIAAGPATRPAVSTDFALRDPTGALAPVRVDGKATVLIFVGIECPISNSYAPEINAMAADFSNRGVAMAVIYAGADVTAAAAAKHHKDFSLTPQALLDPACELTRAVGVKVSPEAVVLRPDGTVAYRGRIDDRVVAFGKKRQEATTHDLRDAVNAVLKGREPVQAETKAVGCAIVMPEKTK